MLISLVYMLNVMLSLLNDVIYLQVTIDDQVLSSFIDEKDGEIYRIIVIGKDTWMAQNLRFDMPGAIENSNNPYNKYGRLYSVKAAQEACPNGWHIATEQEWNQLEIEHGMPVRDSLNGGWRGEHAPFMRASSDWTHVDVNNNALEFNVLPAGYYFDETIGEFEGFEGLGYSAAF